MQLNGFKYYVTLTIQAKISYLLKHSKSLNSSIWPINETLTGTTTADQTGSGKNGNGRVLHILQSSWTEASPSDVLVSGHLLIESYSFVGIQSAYFTAPADWAFPSD